MSLPFDREIELEKLNTAKENVMKYLDIVNSLIIGSFISLTASFLTVFLGKSEYLWLAVSLTIVLAVVTCLSWCFVVKLNKKFLRQYDKWLEKIQKGEVLPSTVEMIEAGDCKIIKKLKCLFSAA
jgi:hypothetical protein